MDTDKHGLELGFAHLRKVKGMPPESLFIRIHPRSSVVGLSSFRPSPWI